MQLEHQVKQLTVLMADLVPTVDRLAHAQERNMEAIEKLTQWVGKTNLSLGEMRTSNFRLADAIEKLIYKIDRMDQFEERLSKLERTITK
jgi:hypothetical protein